MEKYPHIPKKIIIIEDSRLTGSILERRFQKAGHSVFVFSKGKEGLAKIKELHPDLVILDLVLPDLPGEEICREIKRDECLHHIPVIILTAKTNDADRIVARVIGADAFLTKPLDMKKLLEESGRLLSRPKHLKNNPEKHFLSR
ncbi:MAG: response regulator [Candidatus Omnitrophica bacterium]|nr:response regulator [Candidatus Omnitrophota bacterium]